MSKNALNLECIYVITSSLKKYLEPNSIHESDIKSIIPQLEILISQIPLPSYQMIPAKLERLIINDRIPPNKNERLNNIRNLKYPPAEIVKRYGRCNVINNSVLYGAFGLITVIQEMRPRVGQAITHAFWKVKENYSLKWFPIFFITELKNRPLVHNPLSLDIKALHEETCCSLSAQDKIGYNMAMEFLANCFAKDVEINNHFDYFLSSYISKKFFDNDRLAYDGILYPSVQSKLGSSNMAIRPKAFEQHFYLTEVRHEINIVPPGKNGFNYATGQSTNFDLENDLIIWDKN